MRASIVIALLLSMPLQAADIGSSGGGTFSGGDIANQIKLPDGTVGRPSWGWTSDDDGTGTGCYRSAANEIACGLNGVLALKLVSGAVQTYRGVSGANGGFSLFSGAAVEYMRVGFITGAFSAYLEGFVGGGGKGIIAIDAADAVVAGALSNKTGTQAVFVVADTISASTGSTAPLQTFTGAGGRAVSVKSTATCTAGTLAWNPSDSAEVVLLTTSGAGCVVTINETAPVLGSITTMIVADSPGVGVVTFPDSANVSDVPALCSTTGLTKNGSLTIVYADEANDMYVGTLCVQL